MRAPEKSKVSDFTFREALRGNIDLVGLPFEVARQILAMQRRLARMHARFAKRETKAAQYAAIGLNGKRAVARRLRQIAAGSLTEANGLVSAGAWTDAQFGKVVAS
jgi:hypothetical protein